MIKILSYRFALWPAIIAAFLFGYFTDLYDSLPTGGTSVASPMVFSLIHAKPQSYCDSFARDKTALNTEFQTYVSNTDIRNFTVRVVVALALNKRLAKLYDGECASGFRDYIDPYYVIKAYQHDLPVARAYTAFGWTEALLPFASSLISAFGFASLVYVLHILLGGRIAAFFLLGLTYSVMGTLGQPLPEFTIISHLKLFFPLTAAALLHLAVGQAMGIKSQVLRWAAVLTLAAIFGIHYLLYYISQPFLKLGALVTVGALLLLYILRNDWKKLSVTAVMLSGLLISNAALLRLDDAFQMITPFKHLNSESFALSIGVYGLGERPSPVGMLPSDEAMGWMVSVDPLVALNAPALVQHQTTQIWGHAIIESHFDDWPFLLKTIWRRAISQLAFHYSYFVPTVSADDSIGTWDDAVLFAFFSLSAILGSVFRKNNNDIVFMAMVSGFFSLFGVNVLVMSLHFGATYSASGLYILATMLPALMLMALSPAGSNQLCLSFSHSRQVMVGFIARRRLWAGVIALAVVGLGGETVHQARAEAIAIQMWRRALVWGGHPGFTPEWVVAKTEELQAVGGDPPERIAAFAASVLFIWHARTQFGNVALWRSRVAELDELRESYLRKAAAVDPRYLYLAKIYGLPHWPEDLQRALAVAPDSLFAARAAFDVLGIQRPTVRSDLLARFYERKQSELLIRWKASRPGFDADPSWSGQGKRSGNGEIVLPSGGEIMFPIKPTLSAHLLKLASYIHVIQGSAIGRLVVDTNRQPAPSCPELEMDSDTNKIRFRVFTCGSVAPSSSFHLRVKAGSDGATIRVRDYYPLVEFPFSAQ